MAFLCRFLYRKLLRSWACIIDDPECYHHDIISYHGNHEYCVRAKQDENGKWFVLIRFYNDDAQIVVEDGKWYFV